MREPLLDKLDRKMGRYALRNLMLIIIIGTGIVWLLETIVSEHPMEVYYENIALGVVEMG